MNNSVLPESTTDYSIPSPVSSATEYRVDHLGAGGSLLNATYIAVGSEIEPVHSRGTVLLVVDTTVASTLDLQTYKRDLIGDGWNVLTTVVPRADVPRRVPSAAEIAAGFASSQDYIEWKNAIQATKAAIRSVYGNIGGQLKSIFMIGHVAVPYSGGRSGDNHTNHGGATPADLFYGDMGDDAAWSDSFQFSGMQYAQNNNYVGDGKFDDEELPFGHHLSFGVGRVDSSLLGRSNPDHGYDVPLASTSPPTPTATASIKEVALLQNYFERNHNWRAGSVAVERKAAFSIDPTDYVDQYNPTQHQLKYHGPLSPNENRLVANVGSASLYSETWVDVPGAPAGVQEGAWLWGVVGGQGLYAGINQNVPADADAVQTNNVDGIPYNILNGQQYADAQDTPNTTKVVFNQFFGSYIGDWDKQGSLLMSTIAQSGGLGLATIYAGRPESEVHTMALGETLADAQVRSMQQSSGYIFNRGTEMSLLGDPTLHQDVVKPVSDVHKSTATTLTWTASPEAGVAGYYIYRSANASAPFVLLNDNAMATGTTNAVAAGDDAGVRYMVRAAKLTTTPSGSYWNLSTGVMTGPTVYATTFNWETVPQTIDIDFYAPRLGQSVPVDASKLSITGTRLNDDGSITSKVTLVGGDGYDYSVTPGSLSDTWRITFHTRAEQGGGILGLLPNGRWNVRLSGDLTNAAGQRMGVSVNTELEFLLGDLDGNGTIDRDDLNILSENALDGESASPPLSRGDLDGDGEITQADKDILETSEGQAIAVTAPPTVYSTTFNWETVPQTIDIDFYAPRTGQSVPVDPSKVTIVGTWLNTVDHTTTANVTLINGVDYVVTQGLSDTWRITFQTPADHGGGTVGLLPNGRWNLTLSGDLTNAWAKRMGADLLVPVSFLLGDLDGNGTVDELDKNILSANYGSDEATYMPLWRGDLNNDGEVNEQDMYILMRAYDQSI